ncbi:MAG: SGNH/GDSL hydrolase family protein [Planctomycetota bacterium]
MKLVAGRESSMGEAVSPSLIRGLLGFVGLGALPLFVVIDTFLAMQRGWQFRWAGNYRLFVYLSVLFLAVELIAWLIPATRRRIGARVGQWASLGISVFLGVILGNLILPWIYPTSEFHLRPANAVYEYDPNPFIYNGVNGLARSSYNSQGVRGEEMPPRNEAYRILCVGGSTTECYFLDDSENWPAKLQKLLNDSGSGKTWVGTAAVSEFASGHHAQFVERSKLAGEVDCLVVLVGGNDLLRLLLDLDDGSTPPPLWLRSNLMELVRVTWSAWNASFGAGFVADRTGEKLSVARKGPGNEADGRPPVNPRYRERPLDVPASLERYANNLRQLIHAAKQRGVRVVLVTEPSLWDDLLSPQAVKRLHVSRVVPYPRDWDLLVPYQLADLMHRYNQTLQRICLETGAEHVDAATPMDGQEPYFYDDLHLNEKGCEQLATILADYLKNHPPKSPSK